MRDKINNLINKISIFEEKISKPIINKISNIKLNKPVILVFVIIFILLGVQHSVISMYFDDFGNASLSYGRLTPNVIGTNFNIPQLLEWASFIYNNWGGRILYAITLLIPLLKNGVMAYMAAQTIVITLIFFVMYKIIRPKISEEKAIFIPILLFILYACINIEYLRHGIYWASASILYVWPILPLFFLIYTYCNICNKIKENKKVNYIINIPLMIFLAFVTTFSQEQIGISAIVFIISFIVINHIKEIKKYILIDLPLIITSIAGYLLLFLAPGNWVRMDTNVEFAKLSFIEKIVKNYPAILRSIFVDKMNIFIAILTIGMFYMILKIIKDKYLNDGKKNYLWLLTIIGVLLINAVLVFVTKSDILFVLFGTIWFLSMAIISYIYYKNKNMLEIFAMQIAAAASIFCLLMSPSLAGRTGLPFIFFTIIFSILILFDMFNSKSIIIKSIVILLVISLSLLGSMNYIRNYKGYKANSTINSLNFSILKKYNGYDKEIYLYKVKNSSYGSTMSYEEPTMDFWIKDYFNIPQKVEFKWIDIYKGLR